MNITTNNNVSTGKRSFVAQVASSRRFSAMLMALLLGGVAQGQAMGQFAVLFASDGLVSIENGDSLGFDDATVGESSGRAITLRNIGTVTLQLLGQPAVSGSAAGDFTLNQIPTQIQPGGFIILPINFTPSQAGLRTAVIRIFSNSVGVLNYDINVFGEGLAAPQLSVADALVLIEDGDTLQLDEAELGQSSGKALTVRNFGDGTLEFTALQNVIVTGADAADFEATLAISEIAPGGFAVLTIGFTPSQAGERIATIRIPSNDPNQGNYSFKVAANAVEAAVAMLNVEWDGLAVEDGDTLDFAEVTVGETATSTLELFTFGDAVLTISAIEISGEAAADYSIDVANASLLEGAVLSAELKVAPSETGPRTATLTIFNDGVDGNIVLNLSAEGVEGIVDCNENGIDDANDLLNDSDDCNTNNVPDECETDSDNDGVIDACDNCKETPNADQEDFDDDGYGDLCDNCEEAPNANQQDADGDGWGNACDNCPQTVNVDQSDSDADGIGDICELDEQENDDDDDDDVEDDDQQNNDNQDDNDDQDFGAEQPIPGGSFCGVGVAGMIPAMMFGLCGMRKRRRA